MLTLFYLASYIGNVVEDGREHGVRFCKIVSNCRNRVHLVKTKVLCELDKGLTLRQLLGCIFTFFMGMNNEHKTVLRKISLLLKLRNMLLLSLKGAFVLFLRF